MKAQWLKLSARYDALQLRERWMVALCVLGGMLLIGYSLLVEPALKRAQVAERSLMEQSVQITALQAQRLVLQSPEQDPDVAAQAELAHLKKQLSELSSRFVAMENSLVPPQHMTALLEDMIGRKTSLRLLSLKTLPVAPLLDKKAHALGALCILDDEPRKLSDDDLTVLQGMAAYLMKSLDDNHGVPPAPKISSERIEVAIQQVDAQDQEASPPSAHTP